ncbi:MAG TPA: tRNA pseudouridine(38-40) synthase TruA [Actinomycetota bacterium]|nr:tRNA pseudouridine(38-40) synthase TruA [Actinomycetota bacterium]
MAVIRLLLAYDGTDFHGWARQPGLRTVQGAIEGVLERLLGEVPPLSVAGRTDAGVHAEGQVASFPAPERLDPGRVQRALNAALAPEVVVLRADRAPEGFDARRSARAREYLYRLDTSPLPHPFTARFVWHRAGRLSVGRMRRAAGLLVGEHDFASFCRAPKVPASTVRRLERLAVSVRGERVEVRARANAFLHQMVRSLVGTLVAVGEGRMEPEAMPAVLEARSRAAAGPVAPPHGLSLVRVWYGRAGRETPSVVG